MEFLQGLLSYGVLYVLLIAVSVGGVYAGKALRMRKNSKTSK